MKICKTQAHIAFFKSQVNFCLDFPNVGIQWFLKSLSSHLRVSDCRRLFSNFHCSKKYEVPPLYYVYSIPICSNSICSTFLRAGRLEQIEGLLYLQPIQDVQSEKDKNWAEYKPIDQYFGHYIGPKKLL